MPIDTNKGKEWKYPIGLEEVSGNKRSEAKNAGFTC
jgi:hypothetical protein